MTSAFCYEEANANSEADPNIDKDIWTMPSLHIKLPCKYSFYIMQFIMKTNNLPLTYVNFKYSRAE